MVALVGNDFIKMSSTRNRCFKERVFWQVWLNRKSLKYSFKKHSFSMLLKPLLIQEILYSFLWVLLFGKVYLFLFSLWRVCQHVWCICVQFMCTWCTWAPSEGIRYSGRSHRCVVILYQWWEQKQRPRHSFEVLLTT